MRKKHPPRYKTRPCCELCGWPPDMAIHTTPSHNERKIWRDGPRSWDNIYHEYKQRSDDDGSE